MPSKVGVDPFGCSVADVAALTPEAMIPDSRGAGQKVVIEAEVEDWIKSLSAQVAVAILRWDTLGEPMKTYVIETARTIIANGAASYLEAARAPERAGLANSSYTDVLWSRYTQGLAALQATVNMWLEQDPTTVNGLGAASFPPVGVPDHNRW